MSEYFRTNRGVHGALLHAASEIDEWPERALDQLRLYPKPRFTTKELREYAYAKGLPHPPSERAWGGVIMEAIQQRLIMRASVSVRKGQPSIWQKL